MYRKETVFLRLNVVTQMCHCWLKTSSDINRLQLTKEPWLIFRIPQPGFCLYSHKCVFVYVQYVCPCMCVCAHISNTGNCSCKMFLTSSWLKAFLQPRKAQCFNWLQVIKTFLCLKELDCVLIAEFDGIIFNTSNFQSMHSKPKWKMYSYLIKIQL